MLETAVKTLSGALSPLVGGVGKEVSGYLADHIRFFRWKSSLKILKRAKEFCGKEKIDPSSVPIKFIIPFLELSSLEDTGKEKKLTDMWASLLATAVTTFQARQITYIDILKKLSSNDAKFLIWLLQKMKNEDIYWDEDGFDPDLWNVNDRIDIADSFAFQFEEGGFALRELVEDGGLFPNKITELVTDCVKNSTWRVDTLPVRYDLSLFEDGEFTSGVSGPVDDKMDTNCISNLVALGVLHAFETSTWYPQKPKKGDWGIRGTASFVCVTSLGFDFMKSCLRNKMKRRRKKPR